MRMAGNENILKLEMVEVTQSIYGLCNFNQGRTSTTGEVGEGRTKTKFVLCGYQKQSGGWEQYGV